MHLITILLAWLFSLFSVPLAACSSSPSIFAYFNSFFNFSFSLISPLFIFFVNLNSLKLHETKSWLSGAEKSSVSALLSSKNSGVRIGSLSKLGWSGLYQLIMAHFPNASISQCLQLSRINSVLCSTLFVDLLHASRSYLFLSQICLFSYPVFNFLEINGRFI